uniref:Putative hydrolase n=1 Tax=Talaromyces marneffei PM1 TaxID=1077442 RepID=A0A093XH97_TALMA
MTLLTRVARNTTTRTLESQSTARRLASTSISQTKLSGLKINTTRLNPTDTGMARLTLTDADAKVRRWLSDQVQKLGCALHIDQMGNMFARQKGRLNSPAPMIAMGSHLDTQPRGGRYDGILGIMAALEVLRTMKESGYHTAFDVGLVNWTKFPKSMTSSGVWAGDIPLQEAWDLRDIHNPNITLKSELERHNYLGEIACSYDSASGYPLSAHFELHIEQGPILEHTNRSIGVVQGSQAYRWLSFTISGRDAHTGTTPLSARRDPLLAASRMIASSNEIAQRYGALASTGIFKIPSNASTNTIASEVTFTLDIRHPDDTVVDTVQAECLESFNKIAAQDGKGVSFAWQIDTDSAAVRFDENLVRVMTACIPVDGAQQQ